MVILKTKACFLFKTMTKLESHLGDVTRNRNKPIQEDVLNKTVSLNSHALITCVVEAHRTSVSYVETSPFHVTHDW